MLGGTGWTTLSTSSFYEMRRGSSSNDSKLLWINCKNIRFRTETDTYVAERKRFNDTICYESFSKMEKKKSLSNRVDLSS